MANEWIKKKMLAGVLVESLNDSVFTVFTKEKQRERAQKLNSFAMLCMPVYLLNEIFSF